MSTKHPIRFLGGAIWVLVLLLVMGREIDAAPKKIMPLGDSITQGSELHNSYRRVLWQMLTNAGFEIDFVGSLTTNYLGSPPNTDFDLDHEGHAGLRVDEILIQLTGYLTLHQPDVVLLHVGSNDILQSQPNVETIQELSQVIDRIRAANPYVVILLAQIIGTAERGFSGAVQNFNGLIPGLAAQKNSPSAPVLVVDQSSGFNPNVDTYDDVHPNDSGELKLAQKWFAALQPILVSPGLPPAPANLVAFAGDGLVELNWLAVPGASSYTIQRSSSSSGGFLPVALGLTSRSFVHLNQANGFTNYYSVAAVNGVGQGASSSSVRVIPGSVPLPLIRLGLNETNGFLATNSGSVGGLFSLSGGNPNWSSNVPERAGGSGAVDFGVVPGDYAVESSSPLFSLAGLGAFTITGWANNRSAVQGSDGNRLVCWSNAGADGVDLSYLADGSLRLAINEPPQSGSVRSTPFQIPASSTASPANWRFFAVTYDRSLLTDHVRFHFGTPTQSALLGVSRSYPGRGAVGPVVGPLAIGHLNSVSRGSALDRMFRGLVDGVQIFGEALSSSQIQSVQRWQGEDSPVPRLRVERATAGLLRLKLSGQAGVAYRILSTSDFLNWSLVQQRQADLSGVWDLEETVGNGVLFFRAVTP